MTSDFGTRLDPYSAERKMHQGLDIATPHADFRVVPGNGGGKPTRVLDHPVKGRGGVGVKTAQLVGPCNASAATSCVSSTIDTSKPSAERDSQSS